MKLITGLGNPGKKYEGTRHNVGFEVLGQLAERNGAGPSKAKFAGEVRSALLAGEKCLLLAPHTFMNLSGRSVREACDFYRIAPAEVLVVCDDFNLPLGWLRMRPEGSDGGQKGLADIVRQLGTSEVPRLRVGIGPVPDRWDAADFVLGKFSPIEQETIEAQLAYAAEAVETWVGEGIDQAMCRYNGARPTE